MALPAEHESGGMAWPPVRMNAIYAKLDEWSAWYRGDTIELQRIYGSQQGFGLADSTSRRRGQDTGMRNALRRWWWGQQNEEQGIRGKLHVPLASDIATASADLLFGEELTITSVQLGTGKARERLDDVLEGCGWHARLLEVGEYASPLAGGYLRVTWDTEVAPTPLLTVHRTDEVIPTFRYGVLTEAWLWEEVGSTNGTVWRHLEGHTVGRVEHALYQGTADKLGRRVPLAEHEATRDLQVDAESGVELPPGCMTMHYLPNIGPSRDWMNDPIGRYLGRSDLSTTEPELDALDEVWTSWMRDIRIGKGRIMVPRNQLTSYGAGRGAGFDMDQEVFVQMAEVAGSAKDAGLSIEAHQFAIRTEDHYRTTKALTESILRTAGYSAQTFGIADEAAATATEIDARERRSLSTREKKTRYVSAPLGRVLNTLTQIDMWVFGGRAADDCAVEFPSSSQPSDEQVAQTLQMLTAAMAASVQTKVRMLHPDWTDTEVQQEADRIMEENGIGQPAEPVVLAPPVDDMPDPQLDATVQQLKGEEPADGTPVG